MNKEYKTPVVIRTDGGICSQMAFYAYGLDCEAQGFDVYYDTDWFDCGTGGVDCDGKQVRNYDLEKAFPNIKTRRLTEKDLNVFKKKYKRSAITSRKISRPTYVSGYSPDREFHTYQYHNFFREQFQPVDAHLCQDILAEMKKTDSCAIHVRRGDLARPPYYYGLPASADYFLKAINYVRATLPDVVFYFFSDGMDWVKDELIPRLPSGVQYRLIDSFGADKGYLDMYMMSQTDAIIGSKGSLGIFAKVLSQKNPILIVPRYNADLFDTFPNCVFINDEIREEKQYPTHSPRKQNIKDKMFTIIYKHKFRHLVEKGDV